MSRWILRILIPVVMTGLLTALLYALVRGLHKEWWRHRAIRRAVWMLPASVVGFSLLWGLGARSGIGWLRELGAFATAGSMIMLMGLLLALPISGAMLTIGRLVTRWREKRRSAEPQASASSDEGAPAPSRRQFLQTAAAAVPVISIATGGTGIAKSFAGTRVPLIPVGLPGLPPALNGLRILHLTDLHLGYYRFLEDLDEALVAARKHKPDLVLLTGDIADDVSLLPGTLARVHDFGAPLGAFSSLGNHEYSRGLDDVLRAHARSPVTLLRSSGRLIHARGQPLYLAGADDPRYGRYDKRVFLQRSVDRALADAPKAATRILLSHRPEGFDPAAKQGVALTLSGHTHGGQLGIGRRSLWSTFSPESYLWGIYRQGPSRLYVSAGMGHWFPFRLGCPAEAPVIELRATPW